jgi:bile acid:Na+ symporter, BASS family
MDPATVDAITLTFSPTGIKVINAVIGLMMFGVALEIRLDDFKRIARSPRAPLIGLAAQFIMLPALTFLLTLVIKPVPSIALGMILVAACPGGNLSNLMTYLANGNTAVSVSMTAVSTLAAIIMTPLNLALWGSLNPATAEILQKVQLRPLDVFFTVFIILGVPLTLGLLLARWKPKLVQKVRKPFKVLTVIIFVGVVGAALGANWSIFMKVIGLVAFAVLLHNALAITLGYTAGRLARLPRKDVRAVALEVGIQNSALGLVLVFNFFDGLGGMAIIVAWWGVWHIIAGLSVATVWSRIKLPEAERTAEV